jgi:hypothetical protein
MLPRPMSNWGLCPVHQEEKGVRFIFLRTVNEGLLRENVAPGFLMSHRERRTPRPR